jgi:very-short-patch-repair endonuclease
MTSYASTTAGQESDPRKWAADLAQQVALKWGTSAERRDALRLVVDMLDDHDKCESPIETKFLTEIRKHPALVSFKPNVKVLSDRYRVDFADAPRRLAVELDGYEFHSSKEAFTNDRRRHRHLELAGWRVIRFSGAEINADVEACVSDFIAWLCVACPTPITPPDSPPSVDPATGRARLGARLKRRLPSDDAPVPAEPITLNVGDDVRHPAFGDGVVLSVEGEGVKAEAAIRFAEHGDKHLALAWSPLTKVEVGQ